MRMAVLTAAMAAILATGAARADVAISKQPTRHMSCAAGVCSPTAQNAVLNATDLANMLGTGDVKVTTGSGATNIVVKDTVSWTSTSRLTLDANQSVTIDKPMMVTGTGAVTITTNDGGTGGDLVFDGKGNVTFWDLTSSLIVNGNSYTLVGDITTLASDVTNNPSGFYALAKDYDASVDGTYSTAPVTTELSGTFEGLGHTIANLKIITTDFYIGLFSQASGGLRDIALLKVMIQSNSNTLFAGSLLGLSDRANIVGCYATGAIATNDISAAGGLVGASNFSTDGTITRSHAAVSVIVPDGSYAGGLVGLSGFFVFHSYASGRIRAGNNAYAGGLVGFANGGISESYATGNVIAGSGSQIGGLFGENSEPIINSYATGTVKGGESSNIGGFAGTLGIGGDVSGTYSIGRVKGTNSGGFVGAISGELDVDRLDAENYWDTDTSGKNKRNGCGGSKCGRFIRGLTTEELQAGLPNGFDPSIWGENPSTNGGYPYLLNNPPR